MSQKTLNRLAGSASILLLVLFAVFVYQYQVYKEKELGFHLNLRFNFLNNLQVKAPVLLNGGMKIGEVSNIYQEKLQTYVRIYLDNKYNGKISRKHSKFSIFSDGLFGQKFINLDIGDAPEGVEVLQGEDIVDALSPPSMDQLLLSFSNTLEESGYADIGSAIFRDLRRLNRNAEIILIENEADYEKINRTLKESFIRIETQYAIVTENLMTAIGITNKETGQSWEQLLANLKSINESSAKLKKSLEKGSGSIARIRNSKKLARDAKLAIKLANTFVNCIQNKPWVLMYKESCS